MAKMEYLTLLVHLLIIQVTWSKEVAMKVGPIVEHIKATVDPQVIPIPESGTEALKVNVKLSLLNLMDVDKVRNEVEVTVWEYLSWTATPMGWDPAEFNNVTEAHIDSDSVWIPDLALYKSLNKPDVITPKIVVVTSDGTVIYVPGLRLRFSCDLYTVDSPSGANCTMSFGSWTYSSKLLTITTEEENNFDLSEYTTHPRYSILKTYVRKDIKKYACCPELYEDFKFIMTIRDGGV